MFGIGGFELFIILLFGFLIFGPEKLPEIAKTVGKGIARFRQAQDEMNSVIKSTDIYDPNSDEPFKDPMEALDKLAQHQEEKRRAQKAASASEKPASTAKASSTASGSDAGEAPTENRAAGTAAADGGAEATAPRQESFTERKARYERERAARKAAEAAGETQHAVEEAGDGATDAEPQGSAGQDGPQADASQGGER